MTLKAKITDLLGGQLKPSDEPLIDELIFNFTLLKKAKDGLETEGLVINTVRDPERDPYYQKNPLFGIYDTTLKNIQGLYSKLNISPLERRNWDPILNAVSDEDKDWDKDFK